MEGRKPRARNTSTEQDAGEVVGLARQRTGVLKLYSLHARPDPRFRREYYGGLNTVHSRWVREMRYDRTSRVAVLKSVPGEGQSHPGLSLNRPMVRFLL